MKDAPLLQQVEYVCVVVAIVVLGVGYVLSRW